MSAFAVEAPLDDTAWRRLGSRLSLAWRVFAAHPAMPATAFWRVFEAEVIQRVLRGAGHGLDLGCGDGAFASVVFPAAPDLSWRGLERDAVDAELARRSGRYEAVERVRGEEMPYADASFDVVFSNCVLEHVEDLDAVLGHVGRVLAPGGMFVFTVPTETFYEALAIPRLLGRLGLARRRARYLDSLAQRLELRHLLSLDGWRQKLAASGLAVRAEAPYAPRRAAGAWEWIATLTGGVAWWVARGRETPRRIQQSAGLAGPGRGWLGAVFYLVLLPVLVFAALDRGAPPFAGRLVVAGRADEVA